MVYPLYQIRANDVHDRDPYAMYRLKSTLFSIKLNHGGFFTNSPNRVYKNEVIDISSDESDGSHRTDSWVDYFPSLKSSSKEVECTSSLTPSSNEVESSINLTLKQLDKMAFAERKKVLGLPSKGFCEQHGIKPFVAKGASSGNGKNKMA